MKMAASFCRQKFFKFQKNITFTQYRSGYIILIPETQKDLPDDNPLLRTEGLPEFSQMSSEKCEAAMVRHAQDFETGVWELEDKVTKTELTSKFDVFKKVIEPLETIGVPLYNTWALIKTLYLVDQKMIPTDKYMNIHDRGRRVRAAKFNSLPIYRACNHALNTQHDTMSEEQRRVVKKFVLEGSLNGLDIDETKKYQLVSAIKTISQKRLSMKGKLEVAVNNFKQTITDPAIVKDFPLELQRLMAQDPTQPTRGPWVVTLHQHVLEPFLEYCPDRNLRWNLWTADRQKNSAQNDETLATSTEVEEIRSARLQQATALGFPTYVHMSMKTKMAETVENVQDVLNRLLEKAKPSQEAEINNLQEFALERGLDRELQLWDLPYWSRKQQNTLFNFNDDQLKDFFPLSQVLLGLFTLCEQLFSIKIEERKGADLWHEDVMFFRVIDEKTNNVLGGLYLDPYTRDGKVRIQQNAGWMVGLRSRCQVASTEPLSVLVFNFTEPLYGKPSLLSFRDVQLLFKRFGHTLQHILSQTKYSEVSGLSNVEWDAVEICSNLLCHWLYDRNTLESVSGHYETGEPLPTNLLENLTNLRQHLAGFNLCHAIYLSNLDIQLHSSKEFWLDVVRRLWPEHFLFDLNRYDTHVCSFKEIFLEEWGGAYYCHLWAKMVAADVYSAFVEAGVGNQQELAVVGDRFRSTFLSLGGSVHPSEVFRRFRGRDPSPNALIKELGLKQTLPEIPVLVC